MARVAFFLLSFKVALKTLLVFTVRRRFYIRLFLTVSWSLPPLEEKKIDSVTAITPTRDTMELTLFG